MSAKHVAISRGEHNRKPAFCWVVILASIFFTAGAAHATSLIIDSGAGTGNQGALFSVNRSNGERTLISDFGNAAQGPLGEIPFGLKVNDSGEILVVDEDTGPDFKGPLFSVNP
jgi:hypothetical protein